MQRSRHTHYCINIIKYLHIHTHSLSLYISVCVSLHIMISLSFAGRGSPSGHVWPLCTGWIQFPPRLQGELWRNWVLWNTSFRQTLSTWNGPSNGKRSARLQRAAQIWAQGCWPFPVSWRISLPRQCEVGHAKKQMKQLNHVGDC